MFIHLITICIGLIIAFGLQQLVELFQRRRRIRKAEADRAAADAGTDRNSQ
jgi:outer membrane protein TolC